MRAAFWGEVALRATRPRSAADRRTRRCSRASSSTSRPSSAPRRPSSATVPKVRAERGGERTQAIFFCVFFWWFLILATFAFFCDFFLTLKLPHRSQLGLATSVAQFGLEFGSSVLNTDQMKRLATRIIIRPKGFFYPLEKKPDPGYLGAGVGYISNPPLL